MPEIFEHKRSSRNASSYAMVGGSIAMLFALIFALEAHPFVIGGFGVLISPAIWSILKNTQASLSVDDASMTWRVGQRGDSVHFEDIEYVRARTALDLSQRVTVFRKSGPELHVPGPCLPSGRTLDQALEARGVLVKRLF